MRKICLLCIAAMSVFTVPLVGQRGGGQAATDAAACQALLLMPNVTVTYAALRPAADTTPEYCYVRGTISGTIRFHMQLPLRTSWNGRLGREG